MHAPARAAQRFDSQGRRDMRYYVNDRAQANGDHEVHEANCTYVPKPENRTYLGDFSKCSDSIINNAAVDESEFRAQ